MKGPITIGFLEKRATVNSTSYCQLLINLIYLNDPHTDPIWLLSICLKSEFQAIFFLF